MTSQPTELVEPGAPTVRAALLDDHELLLDSLSTWIRANEPDFDLVLTASTWAELVHSPLFPPDLVMMDLQLAEPVSIEARVRTCLAAGATVMVLTAIDTPADRERALAAGAAAYVTKTQPVRDVMAEARRVTGLPPDPAADASLGTDGRDPGAAADDAHTHTTITRPRLSEHELLALTLYVAGETTAAVAESMGVGYETAKTYLRRIREKYARAGRPTSSRADLVRRAAEDGYLT